VRNEILRPAQFTQRVVVTGSSFSSASDGKCLIAGSLILTPSSQSSVHPMSAGQVAINGCAQKRPGKVPGLLHWETA
jgi:hypothetical protein